MPTIHGAFREIFLPVLRKEFNKFSQEVTGMGEFAQGIGGLNNLFNSGNLSGTLGMDLASQQNSQQLAIQHQLAQQTQNQLAQLYQQQMPSNYNLYPTKTLQYDPARDSYYDPYNKTEFTKKMLEAMSNPKLFQKALTKEAPLSNLDWLDQRVNEMRVRL